MYLDFFGLKEAPFRITPNTEYWHDGGQRGDVLAALLYAIGQGEGIVKVVGEVGSGKTMLCRKLAANLPDTIDSVYLGNPTLDADDMLAAILAELGVSDPSPTRQARLAQLNTLLLERHAAGRRVVVFVEEAQGISLDNLEFLRLLTNLETATDKLLQIVLFGQPELDAHLADPRIRQLKDRITVSLSLSPLSEAEVGEYLRARLAVAGYRGPDLFPPAVVAQLHRLSGGLSRRINVLADKTLLAAYAAQTHSLTSAHVDAAAGDAELIDRQTPAAARTHRGWRWLALGAAAVLALLGLVVWLGPDRTAPSPSTHALTPAPRVPAAAAAVPAPDTRLAHRARETAAWLATAPAGTHVIQLASAKDAAEAAVLLGSLAQGRPQPLRVFYGLSQGQPAWMLLAGEFPDRASALAALRTLPDSDAGKPFLRTVGKMRTVVLATE
ncbi:MAG: AAA family ATPase [Thiobacillus sp.]|nr:AAA family ATPase [Thiobacillus sp.]